MVHWGCFIAYKFSRYSIEKLTSIKKEIESDFKNDVAWHSPQYYHMTLFYFGWINSSQAKMIKALLDKFQEKFLNIRLYIDSKDPILFLGNNGSIEYITLKLRNNEYLKEIHFNFLDELIKHNVAPKNQKFIPHISIGRIHYIKDINNYQLINSFNETNIIISFC